MHILSKICDAADWFDPELLNVILDELQEPARFHRKQWEFAIIFLALRKYGMLNPDKKGLSLGGGNERVLYSIARYVRQLVVTDLYDNQTSWDCARTDDPDNFIKQNKPFAVDDRKLEALRMDMRQLEFEDDTFDFCYSSCAIEHIGEYDDFLRHLNEVYRVLKEGGIYVFTTEFQFGEQAIKDENNYIFSPDFLRKLISESRLSLDLQPQVNITPHSANLPFPGNVKNLCYRNEQHFSERLAQTFPHLQLLRGKHPFTSISFVLLKNRTKSKIELDFPGYRESRHFLENGIEEYRRRLREDIISINPFSAMGRSPFFADHADFFSQKPNHPDDNTVFHSDYFWLGSGERHFRVCFSVKDLNPFQDGLLQIRVHRYETLNSRNVECVEERILTISGERQMTDIFSISVDDNYCYAVLGKLLEGSCQFSQFEILGGTRPFQQEPGSQKATPFDVKRFMEI